MTDFIILFLSFAGAAALGVFFGWLLDRKTRND